MKQRPARRVLKIRKRIGTFEPQAPAKSVIRYVVVVIELGDDLAPCSLHSSASMGPTIRPRHLTRYMSLCNAGPKALALYFSNLRADGEGERGIRTA